ncbi:hypothetical protein [Cobetia amphilecti]|uniref:hypothetical protein n=1 Tax=Cobetia amphilecti TaxID=1055104 RepID=UPI001C08B6B4|nr:hypothetical protein [Cobetia amphilecti]MBU3009532.1 hypothetical protein [Cobetia amphilecti]
MALSFPKKHQEINPKHDPKTRLVFLTQSNYNILVNSYAQIVTEVSDATKQLIYKDNLSWILSEVELRYLFAECLTLTQGGTENTPVKLIQKRDSGHLFFSGGTPKYHYNERCEYAWKAYDNYDIPAEIKAKGDKEVERFKKFAQDNKELYREDTSRFFKRLEAQFFLKNPLKKISYQNSGIRPFDDLSIVEIEKRIDEHLKECRNYLEKNPKAKNTKFAPSWYIKSGKMDETERKFHHDFKHKLKKMMREYLKIKEGGISKNKRICLNQSYLDSLGFEGCKACGSAFDLSDFE